RYKLTPDGYGMEVEYTIDDPEDLLEPVTVRGEYRKIDDIEYVPETCEVDTARRHLQLKYPRRAPPPSGARVAFADPLPKLRRGAAHQIHRPPAPRRRRKARPA